MQPVINRSFVKLVEQVIDADGTIKDSAVCSFSQFDRKSLRRRQESCLNSYFLFQSSALRLSRERVRMLERKVKLVSHSILKTVVAESETLLLSPFSCINCWRLL